MKGMGLPLSFQESGQRDRRRSQLTEGQTKTGPTNARNRDDAAPYQLWGRYGNTTTRRFFRSGERWRSSFQARRLSVGERSPDPFEWTHRETRQPGRGEASPARTRVSWAHIPKPGPRTGSAQRAPNEP